MNKSKLVEWRRWLHSHAELSFEEHATAAYIISVLRAEGIECRPIAGTGVLARLAPTAPLGAGKKAVVLRADIDALPVTEETGLAYCSQNEGVMHACGHDMHIAALLGALVMLKERERPCTVFGLFQPGEELLPGGASLVLAEDPFKGYDVTAFYGQHVEPELPVGQFGIRAGEYMAATDELHITVSGRGGHGALRHMLHDPVLASAQLIIKLLKIGNTPNSVLSTGRVEALGATNVVPDTVALQGTLRTFGQEVREKLHYYIKGITIPDIDLDIEIRRGYPSVVNSPELAERAAAVFSETFGAGSVVPLERRMTGEDFGLYTRRYPSLFYRVGVGEAEDATSAGGVAPLHTPPSTLHTPTFNPSEDALPFAAAALAALAGSEV